MFLATCHIGLRCVTVLEPSEAVFDSVALLDFLSKLKGCLQRNRPVVPNKSIGPIVWALLRHGHT